MEEFIKSEGLHMFLHALDSGNPKDHLRDGKKAQRRMEAFLSEEYSSIYYDTFGITPECLTAGWY